VLLIDFTYFSSSGSFSKMSFLPEDVFFLSLFLLDYWIWWIYLSVCYKILIRNLLMCILCYLTRFIILLVYCKVFLVFTSDVQPWVETSPIIETSLSDNNGYLVDSLC
jgi:hypothetical protein